MPFTFQDYEEHVRVAAYFIWMQRVFFVGANSPYPDNADAFWDWQQGKAAIDKQLEEAELAELKELLGGCVEPIVLTPEDQAELEVVMAYVEKYGHQP